VPAFALFLVGLHAGVCGGGGGDVGARTLDALTINLTMKSAQREGLAPHLPQGPSTSSTPTATTSEVL